MRPGNGRYRAALYPSKDSNNSPFRPGYVSEQVTEAVLFLIVDHDETHCLCNPF